MDAELDDNIESGLAAVSDALANASTCFDIWYEMQNGRKQEAYEPVVEEFPVFFETTVVAHLVAMSAFLYSVLETRRGTHSIPGLVRSMRAAKMDLAVLSEIDGRIAAMRPIWVKISRIRNEVFGHRSSTLFPAQVFGQVQLAPDEIGLMISELKEITRTLAKLANTIVSDALSLSAVGDTERLFVALARSSNAA